MTIWFAVTRALTVLNVALLLVLSYVWVQNYRRLRTRFTLGFLTFGGFLLVQNCYALYIYALNPTTSDWFGNIPERYTVAFMLLALFQFGALCTLTWVTRE